MRKDELKKIAMDWAQENGLTHHVGELASELLIETVTLALKVERRRIIKPLATMHKEAHEVWVELWEGEEGASDYYTRMDTLNYVIGLVKGYKNE